ncbi:MAG: hypothetical protein IJ452_06325 [Butyricicoccus sp.]|nr:hypothetical protein [Butyricicoccus sp.]
MTGRESSDVRPQTGVSERNRRRRLLARRRPVTGTRKTRFGVSFFMTGREPNDTRPQTGVSERNRRRRLLVRRRPVTGSTKI